MRIMHRHILIAALLASAGVASAQEEGNTCYDAQTQMEITECVHREYLDADAALNAAYAKATEALQKQDEDLAEMGEHYVGAVDALKRAQRAWIAFRDAQCELAGFEARGGTLEPAIVSACLGDMTKTRTRELQDLYENGR